MRLTITTPIDPGELLLELRGGKFRIIGRGHRNRGQYLKAASKGGLRERGKRRELACCSSSKEARGEKNDDSLVGGAS